MCTSNKQYLSFLPHSKSTFCTPLYCILVHTWLDTVHGLRQKYCLGWNSATWKILYLIRIPLFRLNVSVFYLNVFIFQLNVFVFQSNVSTSQLNVLLSLRNASIFLWIISKHIWNECAFLKMYVNFYEMSSFL